MRYLHTYTDFLQNALVKKFEYLSVLGKDIDKSLWLTFWTTLWSVYEL